MVKEDEIQLELNQELPSNLNDSTSLKNVDPGAKIAFEYTGK